MPPVGTGGPERLRSLALDLPEQLRHGYRSARELPAVPRDIRRVVVVGMGGSAIVADVASNLTDPESEIALSVSRGPALPGSVGPETLAIFTSYSGETWETLSAYDDAARRGSPRFVLTSGGELARRAERDGVPVLQLPPGLPPRAAVGYLLGGLLGVLDPFFPESNDRRLAAAADAVAKAGLEWADPKGAAARCAKELDGRVPYIYADVAFSGLARRWKTQIEENAKELAHFDLLPELFHNALVAWDSLPATEAKRRAVVLLEWPSSPSHTRWGFDYLEGILKARSVPVSRVTLASEDRLEALLRGISFGDHVSLFLADLRGQDPLPVDAITRLKQAQAAHGPAKGGARGSPRTRPPGAPRSARP